MKTLKTIAIIASIIIPLAGFVITIFQYNLQKQQLKHCDVKNDILVTELKLCNEKKQDIFKFNLAKEVLTLSEKVNGVELTYKSDSEIIEGQNALYFTIDLKDEKAHTSMLFEGGQYIISNFNSKYSETLRLFYIELKKRLSKYKNVNCQIYIKGSADFTADRSFKRKFVKNYFYKRISYLKSKLLNNIGEKFISDTTTIIITDNEITNEHLPFLRAMYLKEQIKQYFHDSISILESKVIKESGIKYRNATIYLCIPTTYKAK